jgi:hypothetical protein
MINSTGIIISLWRIALICALVISSFGKAGTAEALSSDDNLHSLIAEIDKSQSLNAPSILKVHPASGFLSDRSTNIQITFNQPMEQQQT